MQKSSFFNSVNGDRKYKAEEWAEYFSSFIGNGIFPNPSTNLMATAGENMAIAVKAGKAWINGYFYYNTNDLTITLDNADGILKRIDRIVVQLSFVDRKLELIVKKGVNSSSPAPPALHRDADIYELALADVYIANGTIKIMQSDITDLRYNTELCGIVTQTVNTIDTSQLAAQLEAWLVQYRDLSEEDYQQLKNAFRILQSQGNETLANFQSWAEKTQGQQTANFEEWFNGIKAQAEAKLGTTIRKDGVPLFDINIEDELIEGSKNLVTGDAVFKSVKAVNANIADLEEKIEEAAGSGGGAIYSETAPEGTDGIIWLRTTDGVAFWWNGSAWVAITSVWG